MAGFPMRSREIGERVKPWDRDSGCVQRIPANVTAHAAFSRGARANAPAGEPCPRKMNYVERNEYQHKKTPSIEGRKVNPSRDGDKLYPHKRFDSRP
jgi:hypothetical protein